MKKIFSIIGILAGLILAVGPYTFLHVCKAMDMEPVCGDIPFWSLLNGIVLILVSLATLFIEFLKKKLVLLSNVFRGVRIVNGIIAIGLPTFIVGVCESKHMHCHLVTKPALIVIGVVVILTTALELIVSIVGERKQ